MKKKSLFTTLAAALLTVALALSLTGCSLSLGGVREPVAGDAYYNSYKVEITNPVESTVAAASRALLSAVSVSAGYTVRGSGGTQTSYARGSGVIYSMSEDRGTAYIVTNYHVIYDASYGISEDIYVFLYGMEVSTHAVRAEYIGGSMQYDLAVLKVTDSDILRASASVEASFADSDAVQVLETVIAVGNASGDGLSATVGHVNVQSEYISLYGADDATEITLRVMRTDAAVNPGNSGGGLFNAAGEVVGIVNAKSAEDSVDNIGYAIPSNVAKSMVENIIHYCDGTGKTSVYRMMLGITLSGTTNPTVEYDEEAGTLTVREDVVIASVAYNGAAAGLLRTNDIIKSITVGDTTVTVNRSYQVIDAMLLAREGMTVSITVLRGGESVTAQILATADMLAEYK